MFQKLTNSKIEKDMSTKINITYSDLLKVILSTLSIFLLNFDSSSKENSIWNLNLPIIIGYFLLLTSIFFDGILALKEKSINFEAETIPKYKILKETLHFDYMYLFNLYSFIFALTGLMWNYIFTDFHKEWFIFLLNWDYLKYLSVGCISASCGQVFLYKILHEWGPLELSVITGIRKIISIGVSIVLFGKHVDEYKIIAIFVGLSVIFWEILEKKNNKKESLTSLAETKKKH
jgi:drug/metabolite transporter (DMT)-like permease